MMKYSFDINLITSFYFQKIAAKLTVCSVKMRKKNQGQNESHEQKKGDQAIFHA